MLSSALDRAAGMSLKRTEFNDARTTVVAEYGFGILADSITMSIIQCSFAIAHALTWMCKTEALLEHMMMQATCINSQLSADAEVVHVMGERAFVVTRLEVRVAQDAGAVSEQLLLRRKWWLHPAHVVTQLLRQLDRATVVLLLHHCNQSQHIAINHNAL